MKTKKEIVENWLPRYTGLPLEKFGKYILLALSKQASLYLVRQGRPTSDESARGKACADAWR